jgi:hypothetical protein
MNISIKIGFFYTSSQKVLHSAVFLPIPPQKTQQTLVNQRENRQKTSENPVIPRDQRFPKLFPAKNPPKP